ncbi:MAG TPA: transporter substrate-binding domain-containing protein [Salinimicrobium sp.]|nr:transporter substrate-binding domain-containing protein [Salinimicrobium sp.]
MKTRETLKNGYRSLWFALLTCLLLISSCENYPRDTYNTSEEIKNGSLMVGYAPNPPWVRVSESGEPEGIEVEIIEGFAETINSEIRWISKSEQSLLNDLENRNLSIVISGMKSKSPWNGKIGVTNSYLNHRNHKHVIAIPAGEHRLLFKLNEFLKKKEEAIAQKYNKLTTSGPEPLN